MNSEQVEDLVRRAQQGDVSAFERLIGEHLPLVRRFARAFAREQEGAADLAQDALLKVYRSIGGYRFQSSFSTWLYAIVRNVYLDDARSRAGRDRAAERPLGPTAVDADPTADPEAPRADRRLEREELRRLVWDALGTIPPEFRATLVLYDIEGLTYEEIAAIENTPLGTVKSRLSRGRGHLRRVLGPAAPADRAGEIEAAGNSAAADLVRPERTEPA
ncbi:MAG TPA: sigma-70 family RNA polymerase sigma factor [Polyangia bacterium]|jgi:RNA polymerase sigma-70 factor (ECF subfamily)|nr:sigma-70 family RNA polymerase sigma factor [Polyangia bacterium]